MINKLRSKKQTKLLRHEKITTKQIHYKITAKIHRIEKKNKYF